MRLVRFEDESGGFAVDLHPLITVISGLPAHVRDRLVHGLAALPRGTDPGGRGAIEVHGVYLDLNRDSLELLELNQDLDVILRASDLPGSEHAPDESLHDDSAADPLGAAAVEDDEIREARRLAEDHDEAYESAVRSVEMLRHQLVEIESEQAVLNRQLGDARVGLDSFAAAGLKVAREELAELTTLVGASARASAQSNPVRSATAEPKPASSIRDAATLRAERDRIEGRLSVLIEQSDHLRRTIKQWRAIDPTPVREAYTALAGRIAHRGTAEAPGSVDAPEHVEAVEPVAPTWEPSPEAEALADEWEAIDARLATIDPPRDQGRERLDALTSHRDATYDAMKLAERNLRQPELDPAAVDRLESIHDEIFELSGRTSRFGAGKQRRRLEHLRAEETKLLEELGFDTWSSYIMGITSAGSDPARRRDYENAVRAYEQAEAELEHAANDPITVEVDPEYNDLQRARADLVHLIEAFLGTEVGADPVPALRAVQVEVAAVAPPAALPRSQPAAPVAPLGDVDGDAGELGRALQEALVGTGANLPDRELSLIELTSLAAGWLETMEQLPQRISAATQQRDGIEEEISELAVELDALPDEATVVDAHQPVEPDPEPELGEPEETLELIEARARVAEGEARVRAHEEAVARIAEVEAEYERLLQRSRELQKSLAEREPRVASLLEQRVAARNRLRRAENNRSAVESARWDNRHQTSEESSRFLGGSAGAEAVEWYVLARLAQQRSVSFVGSVPLVIDDAFANWPVEALGDVFTRLERMGEVIQIVYLTDDPDVGAWARSLGSDRALVLDMRVAS
jgi:hypothetical protein